MLKEYFASRSGLFLSFFVFGSIFFNYAYADGFGSLVMFNQGKGAQACVVDRNSVYKELVMPEIFVDVIYKTPGRDSGAEQLFYPIRNIAKPLAALGSSCLIEYSLIKDRVTDADHFSLLSCNHFAGWINKLVSSDALYFDRAKHNKSPVSFVTGTLSGNLTIRPIAAYVGVLRDMKLIHLEDNKAFDEWLERRVRNYNNVPSLFSSAAAQNLVLNSVLSKLTVGIAVDNSILALNEAEKIYRLYFDNARSDGSFPSETRRGVSALKYTNMATGGLVMLAELAMLKGRNLYDYRGLAGADIHKSVRFLVDAFADDRNIYEYSKENYAPTDQDKGGQSRNFVRDHLGWMDIYIRRFPEEENSQLLKKLLQNENVSRGSYYDEVVGAYKGCLW